VPRPTPSNFVVAAAVVVVVVVVVAVGAMPGVSVLLGFVFDFSGPFSVSRALLRGKSRRSKRRGGR